MRQPSALIIGKVADRWDSWADMAFGTQSSHVGFVAMEEQPSLNTPFAKPFYKATLERPIGLQKAAYKSRK